MARPRWKSGVTLWVRGAEASWEQQVCICTWSKKNCTLFKNPQMLARGGLETFENFPRCFFDKADRGGKSCWWWKMENVRTLLEIPTPASSPGLSCEDNVYGGWQLTITMTIDNVSCHCKPSLRMGRGWLTIDKYQNHQIDGRMMSMVIGGKVT